MSPRVTFSARLEGGMLNTTVKVSSHSGMSSLIAISITSTEVSLGLKVMVGMFPSKSLGPVVCGWQRYTHITSMDNTDQQITR